jgi:hypothetical protein
MDNSRDIKYENDLTEKEVWQFCRCSSVRITNETAYNYKDPSAHQKQIDKIVAECLNDLF